MTTRFTVAAATAALSLLTRPAPAQEQRDTSGLLWKAARLDREGETAQARAIYQTVVDSVKDPAAKARVQRSLAMSYAFDGDCANTVKYETLVIDYWAAREQADPQNAFYEQGELANEAARVCLEAGAVEDAERWYRRGTELGLKEPAPRKHPPDLWEYRLEHALARIAARRGDAAEAKRQIAVARRTLDGDAAMAREQERFFPYLVGYVALYSNDLATAEAQLTQAIGMKENDRDPFMRCLLAMTYERESRREKADTVYRQAYDLATGHNPAAAFVRPFVRRKLGWGKRAAGRSP